MDHIHSGQNMDADADEILHALLKGTATETGERFFYVLVEHVCKALKTDGAWVTEYFPGARRLRALAFWLDGAFVPDYEYDIAGTPCEPVIEKARFTHIPYNVIELFPRDPDLPKMNAVSYMGAPLLDARGKLLGHLAVLHRKPLPEVSHVSMLFKIFAARASAEIQRLRAERKVQKREQKLTRLIDSAMDAIIELDDRFRVTRINPAALKVFRCDDSEIVAQHFESFLTKQSFSRLKSLVNGLTNRPQGEQCLWIKDGFNARRSDGSEFPAEGSLSRYEMDKKVFFTLIIRDINERLQAERKIHDLTEQTAYLQQEIREMQNFDEIAGQSSAIQSMLRKIRQVAPTDSTVLIEGETGAGKELAARAIHRASLRHDKPLIKVNCAAIPAQLMESEFFGHEKGAFTGATDKREGRFALADGGTIFLDEIAELPLQLQVKLLRVLQEEEFEPVGSSQTRKVDVRVIAATNRNLVKEIEKGNFREDLYYRLHVFPIHVPPLRERKGDISLLAKRFSARLARKMGKPEPELTEAYLKKLEAYEWPGNVRELQNAMERAVITSSDDEPDAPMALPSAFESNRSNALKPLELKDDDVIYTVDEWLALERQNLEKALRKSDWKIAGKNGAASLLGMPPTTLSSRMKALGLKRPNNL